MSAPINDGGPAFPIPGWPSHGDGPPQFSPYGGMTLRDYFAGQALAGWLSSYSPAHIHPVQNDTHESVARDAYALADEMLKAREAQP